MRSPVWVVFAAVLVLVSFPSSRCNWRRPDVLCLPRWGFLIYFVRTIAAPD